MLCFQLQRRAVLAAIATFIGLVFFAMRAYPGGTSWNATAPGHDFWLNYLCDLARPTALNGVANPTGSALAQGAMFALALGLLPWWAMLARLTPSHPRAGRAMRVLGTVAAIGIAFVATLPAIASVDFTASRASPPACPSSPPPSSRSSRSSATRARLARFVGSVRRHSSPPPRASRSIFPMSSRWVRPS